MAHTSIDSDESASEKKTDEKILAEAHARFKLAEEAESDIRKLGLEDLKFRAGEQWPAEVKSTRAIDGRPCLVVNKIPQFIQQVTNDQRQNRPSIKVHPIDNQGDVETAKIIQGLIRHIEYNSNADVAYDTAFDSAITCGFGYFRVVTDYVSSTSFNQEILVKRIRNPFSVFYDPYSKEPDGSDANFALIIEDLPRDEYKSLYPKSELASAGSWDATGNQAPGWQGEDSVRVAEYFYKETTEKKLVLLSTGETMLAEDLSKVLPDGIEVVRERTASVPVIKWCKINGAEILEKTDWLGIYIPIIPVYGQELDIDGERILESLVRNAKDPARMYNYYVSAETEAIALAPRTPFIMAEGQDEGYEADWATANSRNHSVLKYKPTSLNGQAVAPPQRNSFEPAVQAITQARMLASDDIKATTGIYDAALGAKSNETSGIAIQRRNTQAQTSNFHFIDNLTRSLRHLGRVLIDLIPKIYDTAAAKRIIGEDGEQKIVQINEPFEEDGKRVLYQLDAGKYDAAVDVGPSFASKRQEAAASMMEIARAVPQIMQIAGDLMVKSMDWPGAAEIAERLKKTLPPGLAEDPNAKGQELPPEAKAQMEQMGQMIEGLTAKLTEAQDDMRTKRVEIESRERIEMAKLETTATIELAKLESKEAVTLLQSELKTASSQLQRQINELDQRQQVLGMGQPFPMQDEEQPQEQGFEPPTDGATGAEPMEGQPQPTGGFPPDPSIEGNP